jgi:tetratricopeptide (TPR) repeat protein
MLTDLFQQGNYERVLKAAQQQGINPQSNPVEAMIVAASHLELEHPDQALQLCQELDAILGTRVDFRRLHASCLRRSGQLKEAELLYQETILMFPEDLELKNNFANLLIDLNKIDAAKRLLQEILQEKPDHRKARDCLAQLDGQEISPVQTQAQASPAKQRKAKKPLKESVDSSVIDSFSLDPLAMAFSEAEVKEDQRLRRENKKRKPPAPLPALPAVGQEELDEELFAAARQAINDSAASIALEFARELLASSHIRNHDQIYGLLGDAYMQVKQYEAAEACFLIGLELGGKLMHAHVNLVSLASMRRDNQLARRRFATAIEFGIEAELQQSLMQQLEKAELNANPASLGIGGLYASHHQKTQQRKP